MIRFSGTQHCVRLGSENHLRPYLWLCDGVRSTARPGSPSLRTEGRLDTRFTGPNHRLRLLSLHSIQKIVTTISETRKTTIVKEKQEFLFQKLFSLISRGASLSMNCRVCNQETEASGAEYCPSHLRALESVMLAFEQWRVAYGHLSPPDFLQRVLKAPGIGPKAKEVAYFLSENPS